ncbi:MAG: GNAT family N-acetyltransferase [Cellulosilyticaceae bacterium]
MQETIKWEVVPKDEPKVAKNCPKCGGHALFENSGKFRVNANQSKIDVWLIYQCRECKATWNMTLLTRVNPKEIEEELYKKFLANDRQLAKIYAFDRGTHMRNKSTLSYEGIAYDINGKEIVLEAIKEVISIQIQCKYPFDIRLDKILSQKLGISREQVKKLVKAGNISSGTEKHLMKAKLKNEIVIKLEGGGICMDTKNKYDIIAFQERVDLQDKLVQYLKSCSWSSAQLLARFLVNNEFFVEGDCAYFLMDGENVVSFLTLAHQDCIDDKTMTPWIGFVYTDESYRGKRYSETLIKYALGKAKAEGHTQVYLATDHIGLYEKYGFEYLETKIDVFNEACRVYVYQL